MTELLTAAQMRAIEQAAIDSGEVTGLDLMERAGRGVVEAIFEEWPDLRATSHRAVVLCGPGNNGGDGFVVARLLKEWGWDVEVFLYGDPEKLPPDARVNYERWGELGRVESYEDVENPPYASGSHLVVDAMFGTGLTRPLNILPDATLPAWDLLDHQPRAKVVSVDIASGLCSDSGRVLDSPKGEQVFWADLTVTFHRAKPGHYLADGQHLSGKVVVCDIGIRSSTPPSPRRGESAAGWILYPPRLRFDTETPDAVRLAGRSYGLSKASGHKYTHGHALILSGGPGKGGAARLAARGALRIGAGLVTLGVPPAAEMEAASQVTAIMLKRVEDAANLAAVLEDDRLNALCIGPGLGLDDRAADLVRIALTAPYLESDDAMPAMPPITVGRVPNVRAVRTTVLDADALTLISREPDLFELLHPGCVLTPHPGEFARLFPDIAEKLNAPATKGPAYSKVDATRAAAKRAGCVVLFKGPDTVIADPSGRCSINSAHYDRAAPWLATAGSGDVLAGFITGLLARGFDPMSAAETGAWLHVEAARKFGPGLIAEDLPEQLPAVFRDLGL